MTEKTFATKLTELMKEKDVSQRKLASEIGISRQQVCALANGSVTNPKADTIDKLCEYFKVSRDYLLTDTDVKTNDADIKAVCEFTGLSEQAVKCLNLHKQWSELEENEAKGTDSETNYLEYLSKIITFYLDPFLERDTAYRKQVSEYRNKLEQVFRECEKFEEYLLTVDAEEMKSSSFEECVQEQNFFEVQEAKFKCLKEELSQCLAITRGYELEATEFIKVVLEREAHFLEKQEEAFNLEQKMWQLEADFIKIKTELETLCFEKEAEKITTTN